MTARREFVKGLAVAVLLPGAVVERLVAEPLLGKTTLYAGDWGAVFRYVALYEVPGYPGHTVSDFSLARPREDALAAVDLGRIFHLCNSDTFTIDWDAADLI